METCHIHIEVWTDILTKTPYVVVVLMYFTFQAYTKILGVPPPQLKACLYPKLPFLEDQYVKQPANINVP